MYNVIKYEVNSKMALQLVDVFVTPILSCSSSFWGFTKFKDFGGLNLKFHKRILVVKTSTCNAAIYRELGGLPLYINRYVSIYYQILVKTNI